MRKAVLATLFLVIACIASTAGAATIDVHLDRGNYKGPLTVHLGLADEEHEPKWIATRTAGKDALRFEKLDAAVYVLGVHGAEPTQKLTQKVVVGETDERRVSIALPARTLSGQFTHGGKPLAGVTVILEHEQWHWTASLVTGADGALFASLWDEGAFRIDLRGGTLTAPVKMRTALTGSPVARIAVDLPTRRISGTVVDDKGAPLANARVVLRSTRAGMTAPIAVATDAKGRFAYPAVEPGKQTLRVTADGYLASAKTIINVAAADEVIERRIVLESGRPRALELVDAAGAKVARATVLTVAEGQLLALTASDANGRARIATPSGAASVVWILPPDGSLAAIRFDAGDVSTARRVVVPEASASLNVDTLLTDGTPLPNVSLLMRYNGELVPPEVARLLRNGGNSLATNENGRAELARIPSGQYEFWPYMTDDEAEALMASATEGRAPVNVSVAEGPHRATVRFDKRN